MGLDGGGYGFAGSSPVGEGVKAVYAGRSSRGERTGVVFAAPVVPVVLTCGVVPSIAERVTPSDGATALNVLLMWRYSIGEVCLQAGHHEKTWRSQFLIRCVIIVSLPSVLWFEITRYVSNTTTMSNLECYRHIVAQVQGNRQTHLQFLDCRAIIRWIWWESSLSPLLPLFHTL